MKPSPSFAAYDLHLHTGWSYDATTEVESYFRRAQEIGLRCLAITEHHNMDSAEEVFAVAARYPGIQAIRAAELSATTSIGAVDLLCYNLPRSPAGALARVLDQYRKWQQDFGAAISRGMQALGFGYSDEERIEVLRNYRPERALRRQGATHVKNAIQRNVFIARGYIREAAEYHPLMKRVREAVPFPAYPAVADVSAAVKEAGGKVVIAHPTGYFLNADRARMDLLREECGLDGIECAHRRVPPELTEIYRAYCREHGLLSTGGSDCHDPDDVEKAVHPGYTTRRAFACHVGDPEWLDEFLEGLRA